MDNFLIKAFATLVFIALASMWLGPELMNLHRQSECNRATQALLEAEVSGRKTTAEIEELKRIKDQKCRAVGMAG